MAKKEITKEQGTELAYVKAQEINAMVNSLRNTNVGVDSIIALVRLKAELKAYIEEYNTAITTLFKEKYAIEPSVGENGQTQFAYKEHEKAAEIQKESDALANKTITLKSKLNFMSMKELASATEGLPIGILADIAEYLAVKD